MATANLPRHCSIEDLAAALEETGALGLDRKATVLFLPAQADIQCAALTFLCAWGRQQVQHGRPLLIRGDAPTIQRLIRLNFHDHLGLEYVAGRRGSARDSFVPLRLITQEQDVADAVGAICQLVTEHFDQPGNSLRAIEWAAGEILDNVLRHAGATEPGAFYAEYFPKAHRLDVAIVDLGCGILASLGEVMPLRSHGHAITTAVKRGVTRSEDIGQGNGLAGVLEIVKRNHGSLRIWSGDAVYRLDNGVDHGFHLVPALPGTGVMFSLDTRTPVDLRETWIAGQEPSSAWVGATTDVLQAAVAEPTAQYGEADSLLGSGWKVDVATECRSMNMRAPAERLRQKILILIEQLDTALTVDFSGVESASSSFLDELLGRLALGLGKERFQQRVRVTGMNELVGRIASVVINQRVHGLPTSERESPDE